MSKYDPEIEQLKAGVNCAALLERMGGGYKLDERESSRNNLKYRRGAGEIIIINHDGKGWWDPGSNAKGDVFTLAQHLDPSLNFGRVRGVLRQMLGVAPSFPAAERPEKEKKPSQPPAERWRSRPAISQGSRTWAYLTGERQLPAEVVIAAVRADAVREGPYASAWFAHRDERGGLTGIEMRGPNYRGFSEDGNKTLFRLQPGSEPPTRLAVLEAPIDAMSLAALEGMRRDTLYVATAGGMGPGTITGLEREIAGIASRGGVLVAATDADPQGEKYAARLKVMAEAAGVVAERAAPTGYKDWNEALKAHGQAPARPSHPRFSNALADVARAMERPEPTRRPPWEQAPVRMGERVRVIEQREAMLAAEVMAAKNMGEPTPGTDQRRAPSHGPGAQP
jgi:hypothetical protein